MKGRSTAAGTIPAYGMVLGIIDRQERLTLAERRHAIDARLARLP
jgi:hypothetical protein